MTLATQHLTCGRTAPGQARAWLQATLSTCLPHEPTSAALIDDVLLCASELVTNAVQAGCSSTTVRIVVSEHSVRVSVLDDGSGVPRMQLSSLDADRGRGLALVDAIASHWGIDPAVSGKEVWVEFERSLV